MCDRIVAGGEADGRDPLSGSAFPVLEWCEGAMPRGACGCDGGRFTESALCLASGRWWIEMVEKHGMALKAAQKDVGGRGA